MTMTTMLKSFISPDWPAPSKVRALSTTRHGGVSAGPFASFNVGDHVGDVPECVAQNRALLRRALPDEPLWLQQVHGTQVRHAGAGQGIIQADACVAQQPGAVCAIMTADCLPVLFCDCSGERVGAAHAGWRGLAAGVLEQTLDAMGGGPDRVMAWLGPAIGADAFEVGDDVRQAFLLHSPLAAPAFRPSGAGKWLADLYLLARQRLAAAGVKAVYGGDFCTYSDSGRFFSYRRDGITGRMASLVWLE